MPEPDVAHREEQASEPSRDDHSPIRLLVLSLVVGGAYYVGALIGFALTFPTSSVSTLWPPNAILLASLLLTPTKTWGFILLGVFPAHLAVQLQAGVPILMMLCWFISNSAEALIGAFCVRYFIPGPVRFDSFRHVAIFTTFAVVFSPFITSFLDAGFVVLNQWREVHFWQVWKMRFHANVLAALTLVPAIVLWMTDGVARLRRASLSRCVEGGLLISGLLIISYLVFGWQSAGPNTLPTLVYMPMPFLLWAAVRFGPLGSSTCVLMVMLLSIWGTIHGRGPFIISSSPAETVFFLQLFLIVVSVPLFFLAALLEERRRAEQTRAQAAAIVESSNDAIIGETLDGIITSWNRGAEKLFGYSAEEALGRPDTILMPSSRGDGATQKVEKLEAGAGIHSYEALRVTKGGRAVHVSVTVSHVTDAGGKVTGLSSITRNITERKRAESELQLERAELAHLTRISTMGQLAVSLAHELNQPLTAILSNAQAALRFLSSKPVDLEEVREILQDIVKDNSRAGDVIRRIRALVKKEELDFGSLDLANVIREIVLLLHSDAVLRNVRVSLDFSPELPQVRGDKIQLQQVLLNLLLNAFDAMKECPTGQREVLVRVEFDGAGMVEISVSDHGTGLTRDKLDKIFQPFFTTKRDGLGMGLSISRSIIEGHGGRLWAQNNDGRGATFYFTVPVAGNRGRIRAA